MCWSGGRAAETCCVRALPQPRKRPRQESCQGLANVPGKSLAGNLPSVLHKDLHATMQAPLDLGLDIVDVSELSTSNVVVLLRLRKPSRQGACRGSQITPARILPGAQLVCCSLITGSDAILVG